MIFGRYAQELTGIAAPESLIAVGTLMILTIITLRHALSLTRTLPTGAVAGAARR